MTAADRPSVTDDARALFNQLWTHTKTAAEYPLEQLEQLQAAVNALPPTHRCPHDRLWACGDHPGWRIVHDTFLTLGPWWVIAPGPEPTLIRVADKARRPAATYTAALAVLRDRQLAAIQNQPQEVPC